MSGKQAAVSHSLIHIVGSATNPVTLATHSSRRDITLAKERARDDEGRNDTYANERHGVSVGYEIGSTLSDGREQLARQPLCAIRPCQHNDRLNYENINQTNGESGGC